MWACGRVVWSKYERPSIFPRSITGVKIRDKVSVPDLLERAGIPSVNRMVVNAVAMETWNCRHSSDAGKGAKNLGPRIFDQIVIDFVEFCRIMAPLRLV
jgi:hypothetical protein